VEVCEVELQMDLVVQHVLAERAAEHGLDRVLRHHVHSQAVQVRVAELAVGTLVHLEERRREGREEHREVNEVRWRAVGLLCEREELEWENEWRSVALCVSTRQVPLIMDH
jgi:hypothetical protein